MSADRTIVTQLPEQLSEMIVLSSHPTTGQLMAPGSKVWPWFVDNPKWGRQWIGPKAGYPVDLHQQSQVAEILSANKADGDMDQTMASQPGNQLPNSISNIAVSTIATSPATLPVSNTNEQIMFHPTLVEGLTRGRPSNINTGSIASICKWYNALLEEKNTLRRGGRIEESNLIQSAINVGVMLGWDKRDVLNVVQRWRQEAEENHESAVQIRGISQKMREVAAEVQRVQFKGDWKEMRELTEAFKGDVDVSRLKVGAVAVDNRRVPGMLMLIQASVSVAFWKCVDTTVVTNPKFDEEAFETKATLYFRTPTKACGEERQYLLQMSRLGTRMSGARRFAACPGIERALNRKDKVAVLEAVKSQMPMAVYIIETVTRVLGNLRETPNTGNGVRQGSVTRAAMERMSDEGFLALDYVFRQGILFPILTGDEIIDGEEEEEEESESNSGAFDNREKHAEVGDGPNTESDVMEDNERPSLIVRLRYRRS